jgi:hypothetical protein
MTSLPMHGLHERLDLAAALHPESKTLADFRADAWLVEAEAEALRAARRIVTPHAEVAALYAEKVVRLDWQLPRAAGLERRKGDRIVFPAATVGRKGAYEMREAARRLSLSLRLPGAQLEGENFWRGVEVEDGSGAGDWLDGACAVVLPAFVEHRPRRLLEAVARGVPVIASSACGLEGVKGVTSVPTGDTDALCIAIEETLTGAGTLVEQLAGSAG